MDHDNMPTRVTVSKEQAGAFSIGSKVSLTLSGVVTGIHESMYAEPTPMGHEEKKKKEPEYFEVELKKTTVSGIEGNKANRELEKMTGKKHG